MPERNMFACPSPRWALGLVLLAQGHEIFDLQFASKPVLVPEIVTLENAGLAGSQLARRNVINRG
jgi:hypothetical protein